MHKVLLYFLQACSEDETASGGHFIVLLSDSESTEEDSALSQRHSALKSKTLAERKELEELHKSLVYHVWRFVSRYRRQGKAPDLALKGLFGKVYARITEILCDQLSTLIMFVDSQRDLEVEPFKSISQKRTEQCKNVHELFSVLGFTKAWLNTDDFMDVISASSYPVRDNAMYCMKVYRAVVRDVCHEVFLSNIPPEVRVELKAIKASPFRSLITVTCKKELKDFNLAELLENREYLHRMLKIPLSCFEYLKAEPTHSTTVYWEVDAIYTAQVILDMRQGQIFWSLMEQGIIDFHIEGNPHLSLRGQHIPGLIKNALMEGQNLIKQTKVCVCCTYVYRTVVFHISAVAYFVLDIQSAIPCSSCTGCDTPFTQGEQTTLVSHSFCGISCHT